MKFKADQVAFVFQVGSDLTVKIEHIVYRDDGLLSDSLFALAQLNCSRRDGSVEPFIFVGVITMTMLRRMILEVGNDEFSFIQIYGVLDK